MLGAIVGDIVGSSREFNPIKTKDFPLFDGISQPTDDTVLTLAVGRAILDNLPFAETLRDYALAHPTSYGHGFWDWAMRGDLKSYGSWGNGASMRTSACAWLASDLAEALNLAERQSSVTHDHPQAIRGAQATTLAIYLARVGWDPRAIRTYVARISGYDLSPSVDEFRETSQFEVNSWLSVPRAIVCALEARDFEDAIRNAVSLGGDADTEACIAGAIAEARFGGVPADLEREARSRIEGWDDLLEDLAALRASVRSVAPLGKVGPPLSAWKPACVDVWNAAHRPAPEPDPRPNFDMVAFMEGADGAHPRKGILSRLRGLLTGR